MASTAKNKIGLTVRKPVAQTRTRAPAAVAKTAPKASLPAVNTGQEQPAPRFVTLPGTPDAKPPAASGGGALRVGAAHGETPEEVSARIALHPAIQNAFLAKIFAEGKVDPKGGSKVTGPLDMTACVEMFVQSANALSKNGTKELENMLLSQATALQAIFYEMARRSALNMGEYIEPTEVYLRLALKAQSQCRATIETLAEIKNPRPVYLNPKQVNVANGPQQVNNGPRPADPTTRAEENEIPANKLLEAP
jgi:hypothetical protein